MDTPEQQASLLFELLYWFLVAVAVLFVCTALWQCRRSALQKPFEVTVRARDVDLLMREVRLSKPSRTVIRPYADYTLTLLRTDCEEDVIQTEKLPLSKEELVSLEFLDRYAPNARLAAIEQRDGSGTLDFEPGNRWFSVVGILFGAWMFGTFAWIVRPFAAGAENPLGGFVLKMLSFAALIVAVVVFVALLDRRSRSGAESHPRVSVEAFAREQTTEEFVACLRSAGVNVKDGVAQWLGESVRYCEYEYGGKTWRTTSLYCQPPEGRPWPGRLNPNNPRDVKWEGEVEP
jgi:hypothetical protein